MTWALIQYKDVIVEMSSVPQKADKLNPSPSLSIVEIKRLYDRLISTMEFPMW